MTTTSTPAANAALVIGTTYRINVTGFTYIKDWAMIKGKEISTGQSVGIIIGDKMSFGMSDMFQLKQSAGIMAKYSKDKVVNGVTYQQFQLDEILFE